MNYVIGFPPVKIAPGSLPFNPALLVRLIKAYNIGNNFCNVLFLPQDLLSEDWRLKEMMKTLNCPETFFFKIFKDF